MLTIIVQLDRPAGQAIGVKEQVAMAWDERNKGRPLPEPESAIGVIDEWYRRSKRRYRP